MILCILSVHQSNFFIILRSLFNLGPCLQVWRPALLDKDSSSLQSAKILSLVVGKECLLITVISLV